MIDVIFQFGIETIQVRIDKSVVLFRTQQFSSALVPLEFLKLDRSGVLKEFPDLLNHTNWKELAVERFQEKLNSFTTEEDRMEYIIQDLSKFGYKPLYWMKAGHRKKKL